MSAFEVTFGLAAFEHEAVIANANANANVNVNAKVNAKVNANANLKEAT